MDVVEPRIKAVVSQLDPAAGMPHWWEPLFRACPNGSIFASSDWMQSWLEVYGKDFGGQWVYWESGESIVGGCLMVTRMTWKWMLPMRALFLNATGETNRTTPLAEYNDILCLPGFEESVVTDAARIIQTMRWSRFHALGYRDGALISRLYSQLQIAGIDDEIKMASFVELDAINNTSFEATLAGKVGSHIRRNRRLYEHAYGLFEVAPARELAEAIHFLDELAVLHKKRWESKEKGGYFSNSCVIEFHRKLIGRFWDKGNVDLICVRNDQAVIGYLYNFIGQRKVYVYQSGFAYTEGSKLSPGIMTHALAIEHYRQKGLVEYDLLAGDALYKRSLARRSRALHWTVAYRDSKWSHWLLWARRIKSKLMAYRKTGVPKLAEKTNANCM